MALEQALSAEEQAQMDAMRAADAQPGSEATAGNQAPSSQTAEPDKTGQTGQTGQTAEADKPTQMVPHAALHEERERRKQVEREAAEDRKRWEERFNTLLQRMPQPQTAQTEQPQAEIPPLDKDPAGHIIGTMQQQGATLQQIMGALQEFGQRTQQQAAITQLQQRASAVEHEFRRTNPDYDQAVAHLTADRHAELAEMGYSDPAVRQQIINNDALGIAHRALEQGRNPAEVIYAMAKRRGYKAPDAQPQTAQQQAQPTAEERLRTAQAGQQQAQSLGNARGAAPAPLNAQRLIEMSDADFAKALESADGMALLGS